MNLLRDLGFGLRQITRHPLLSLLIIFTLAIAIGPNVAIFSVLKALVLEPLPYPEPSRLVQVWETDVSGRWTQPFSVPNFEDIREQSECFEALGLQQPRSFNLGGAEPERILGVLATADALSVWGIPPALGRFFTEEEVEAGADLVVLSDELWRRRFGGDPNVLGRSIRINSVPHEIVGIMPADFEYYTAWTEGRHIELWTPFETPPWATRGSHWALAVGRLKTDVPWRKAEAELRAIASRLQEEYPSTNARSQVWIKPFLVEVIEGATAHLLILMVAVGFVLLTACANVASMLLARSSDRRTEVAVRGCLGATKSRLVTQFLTESVLLSFLGGATGVLLAFWSIDLIKAFIPPEIPRMHGIAIDTPVLLFAVILTGLTGAVFGLVPALTAARTDIATVVREGSGTVTANRRRYGLLRKLAIAQIAVAFMLANGAILLFSSYRNILHKEFAFDTKEVLTSTIALDQARYESKELIRLFWRELIDRLESRSGVERAGLASKLPLEGGTNTSILVDGQTYDAQARRRLVEQSWISPGYFEAMGIPLLTGRIFAANEGTEEQRVVVVNQAFVDRYWSDEDPLGQVFRPNSADPEWTATVVGVVADVPQWGPTYRPLPEMYAPFDLAPRHDAYVIVRSERDPSQLAPVIQAQVLEMDENIPVGRSRTMSQVLSEATHGRQFVATLVSLFAVISVILAMAGVFGTLSHNVAQRTREIGVRAAFGAHRSRILTMVLKEGIRLTGIGISVGSVLLVMFSVVLRSQLFGIGTLNVVYLAIVGLVLTATTLIATLLPALRASRIDPMHALRV